MFFCFLFFIFFIKTEKQNNKTIINQKFISYSDENSTETENPEISDPGNSEEIIDGSVHQFEFTSVTYIGFALIFLILIFFLAWKFISSRRRVRAGEMDEEIANDQNHHGKRKRKRNKRDRIQIEVEEDSDEPEGNENENVPKDKQKDETSDAEVIVSV